MLLLRTGLRWLHERRKICTRKKMRADMGLFFAMICGDSPYTSMKNSEQEGLPSSVVDFLSSLLIAKDDHRRHHHAEATLHCRPLLAGCILPNLYETVRSTTNSRDDETCPMERIPTKHLAPFPDYSYNLRHLRDHLREACTTLSTTRP